MKGINNYSILTLVTLISLASCGSKDRDQHKLEHQKSGVIVGTVDWKDITKIRSTHLKRIKSRAVGNIKLPSMGSRCTGFLVTSDILMTNQHCIPSARHAKNVTVIFNHEEGVSEEDRREYICDEFIGNNYKLDFALLRCEGNPGDRYGVITLDPSTPSVGDSVYVIQQNCDYYLDRGCDPTKKIAEGSLTEVSTELTHDADTLGGSSGSPLFSKAHKVIAIHHAGRGNSGLGRGLENYAVPMSRIVPYLLEEYPNIEFRVSGSQSGGTADIFEPNDSKEEATRIRNLPFKKSGLKISKNDKDIFKFVIAEKKLVTIKIEFTHSKGDLDLYLYRSSNSLIKKSAGVSSSELIKKTIVAGTYFVKVKGYKGAVGKYKLTLQ